MLHCLCLCAILCCQLLQCLCLVRLCQSLAFGLPLELLALVVRPLHQARQLPPQYSSARVERERKTLHKTALGLRLAKLVVSGLTFGL